MICPSFILAYVFCALASVGIVGICWRLRHPLDWAQQYDAHITEDGLYGTLPIYGYVRHYLLALLFAGVAILFMSVLVPILVLVLAMDNNCHEPPTAILQVVLQLLRGLLFAHITTIAFYKIESVKRCKPKSKLMQDLVHNLRNRLWGSGLFLFLIIVVLVVVSGVM